MRDKNNNIVCEVCGIAAYMHIWVTNRPEECLAGAVITDEDSKYLFPAVPALSKVRSE